MPVTVETLFDGDDRPRADLDVRCVFTIDARWIDNDMFVFGSGFWDGRARLAGAFVELGANFGVALPLPAFVAFMGQAWVDAAERETFERWAEDEPSPRVERLSRQEGRKHDI